MKHSITVTMPYDSAVSKNSATIIVRGYPMIRKNVKEWLRVLGLLIKSEYNMLHCPHLDKPYCLDITLRHSLGAKGRPPDAANFIDYPQDAIARALGVDDHDWTTRASYERTAGPSELVYTFTFGED